MANVKHIDIDGTTYDVVPSGNYVTGVKGENETNYRTGNVNITKTNVGLGNVPNVTTNNQTPTFSQASTRANIASGETLTTIFGKIMKWFTDLKAVAFSGSYTDLSDKPTIPTVNNATLTIQKNGTNVQTFTANSSSNKTANITVPTKTSELTNDSGYITDAGVTGVKGNSETDYRTGNVNITKANVGLGDVPNVTTNNQTPTFSQASTRANIASGETLATIFGKIMKWYADLKAVAFSGSYTDLSDKPTIPTVNNATLTIQKNGTNVQTFTANQSTNATANITMSKSDVGLGNVGNFKAVSTVASQGLTDTEKSNARANIGAGTSSFSGSYNDLTNKPTIPTVNNATLTIQKNGTNVQTFTANASANKTANITVPTKVSELTNDSGYTTNTGTVTQVKVGTTAYNPSSGVVSLPAYPSDTNNRRVFYGTCSTAAATAAKVIALSDTSGWELKAGTTVVVRFTNTNTASNVTLNVNSSGAKSIYYNNAKYTESSSTVCGYAARTYVYTYDGTYWVWVAHGVDDNTTYSSKAAASGGTDVSLVTTGEKYTWNNKGTGTVTQVKVGTTPYNPSNGVVSLPAYPTVNNGRLTIQKNGADAGYFTANQSGDSTVNITVPTVNNGKLTIQHNGADAGYFTANQSGNTTVNIIDTPFNKLNTNSSKVPIYKDANNHCVVNASDMPLTISAKGLTDIDQISNSTNYPTQNHYLSGTLSDSAGTKVYPCVVAIMTDGKIKLRQKDVTRDTLYLNVNGYIMLY